MRRSLALVIGTVLACVQPMLASAQPAELRVMGSSTVYANIFQPHKDAIEAASGVKLSVVSSSSGRGLADLVAGRADVAMLSSPLADVAKKANEKTPGAVDTTGLKEFKIAESRILFIVHPSNPVKSMTLAQVKDILAGKVTSWKDVGGPDAQILPVTEIPSGGLRTTVEEKVMAGTPIAAAARTLNNGTQIPLIVKQVPAAIGTSNAKHDLSGVKVLELDRPVSQPLFLVTKGAPTPAAAKVIEATAKAAK